MANVTTELKVVVKAVGQNELKQLQGALTDLGRKAAEPAKINFKELSVELKKVQNTTRQTVNNLQAYSNAWKDIARNVEIGSKEFKEATAEAARLDKQLEKVQGRKGPDSRGGAGAALGRGLTALAGVVGTRELLQQGRQAIGASLERGASEQRLRALSAGFDAFASTVDVATRAAERFNLSQTDAQQQLAQVYGRLRPLGLTLQEIESTFVGFNTAARLSGASASESAGAFLQLSQALGSGALRGEEFNSISEQAPLVLSAIAEVMDEPIGALKDLAKEGRITSDIVLRALQDIETKGAARLADVLDTPAAKLEKLNARLEDLRVALGNLALPATIRLIEQLTGKLDRGIAKVELYAKAFEVLNRTIGSINLKWDDLTSGLKGIPGAVSAALPGLRGMLTTLRLIDQVMSLIGKNEGDRQAAAATGYDATQGADLDMDLIRQMSLDARPLRERISIGDVVGDDPRTKAAAAVDNLEERIRLSEQALNLARADLEVQDQIDSLDRIRIKAFRDILELQFKVQNALENETNEIVRRNIEEENRLRILGRQSQLFKDLNREAQDRFNTFFKLTKAQDDAFADAQKRFNNFYKQTTSKLTDTQKLIQSIGGVISGGLTSAFQSLITGAKSLKEILADVLGQIGQLFIQFAVRQALGSINIGGVPLVPSAKGNVFAQNKIVPYANGGVIDKPTVLPLAGEAGPEAILPLQRGGDGKLGVKLNESRMRESMARYSPRQRDAMPAFDGNTDGAIDAANAASATGAIDVRYTVERINSVDYVTADQFQRGMQQAASQGAKQGEQQTLKRLQMSGSTRKRLGM